MEKRCLLQVEDNEDDVLLFGLAAESAGLTCPIQVARDEKEAIEFLTEHKEFGSLPCVILLDLNLSGVTTGLEVLRWLRGLSVFRNLPVIINSSSTLALDIQFAYHFGANAYVEKPAAFGQRVAFARKLKWWLEGNGDLPNHMMNPVLPEHQVSV